MLGRSDGSKLLLDVGNGATRIQVLGAHLGAVHDGVAAVELQA